MAAQRPEPPFAPLGLDHVVLIAADMERAIAFWREVMGAHEERRVERIGLVQMRAGHSLVDLVPAQGAAGGRNVEHVCLRVEPWDEAAIRAHLAAHGVAAGETAARYGADGSGPSIYIEDPDGNSIELKGPPAPPGAGLAAAARREIEDLHAFFVDWLTGACANDAATFAARFSVRMAAHFNMIDPAGERSALADLSAGLRAAHGRNPQFRIEIRDVRIIAAEGSTVTATYTEWQRNALNAPRAENGRISTVTFARAPAAPNGLAWLHLQETWLPDAMQAQGPFTP